MKQQAVPFFVLRDEVLAQLSEHHFLESTIAVYRRIYNRIGRFMVQNEIDDYDKTVGETFLRKCFNDGKLSTSYAGALRCAVRRLDDHAAGTPFRSHHGIGREPVSRAYQTVLASYLQSCLETGNKPATVSAKEHACTEFLNRMEGMGCRQLCELNTETIVQSLLVFQNKDMYAIIRSFLRFLFDRGETAVDFSGAVPKYKRPHPVPSTYTEAEIREIESSIDRNTDTGRRDIAMIMLASRLGMRAGDIAALRFEEIDLSANMIHIIQEKTGIPLTLAMPEELSEALSVHIENVKRLHYPDDYVFHSLLAPYGRITTSIIRHALQNAMQKAGIDIRDRKHGPHSLRASLASSMINDDVAYDTVRKILGHTDPDAIKHYARVDIDRLRCCAVPAPQPSGNFKDYLDGRRRI